MNLEEFEKKNIYKVPDKYFDRLPSKIQARVHDEQKPTAWQWNWNLLWKAAIPAVAVLLVVLYVGQGTMESHTDVDRMLAEVSTDDLIAYVQQMDITTEEIIEVIDFTDIELGFLEDNSVAGKPEEITEEELNALFDEYGIDETIL
jgi:hypothetical protein